MTDYGIYEEDAVIVVKCFVANHIVSQHTVCIRGQHQLHNPRCVQVLSENIQEDQRILLCSIFNKASSLKINILCWVINTYIFISFIYIPLFSGDLSCSGLMGNVVLTLIKQAGGGNLKAKFQCHAGFWKFSHLTQKRKQSLSSPGQSKLIPSHKES